MVNAFNLHAAQYVLCASTEAAEVLKQQGYRGGTGICPIVGVDTRYFYPKRATDLRDRLGLRGFVVGYIGRIVPEKGIDTLLTAAAGMSMTAQVLIVGNGPERERLQALARQLGVAERCRFVDAVPYDNMPDYMNALDMLVLPSRTMIHWKEQFGRVLVEAMACQVVVAGSNSGAIPEVIGDRARIFPEGDAAALTKIIERLANDTAQRRLLAERDQRWAREHYSVEQLARTTLAVWRELCARYSSTKAT